MRWSPVLLFLVLLLPGLAAGHTGHAHSEPGEPSVEASPDKQPGPGPQPGSGAQGGSEPEADREAEAQPEPERKPGPWPPPQDSAAGSGNGTSGGAGGGGAGPGAVPGALPGSGSGVVVPGDGRAGGQSWLGFKGDALRTGATLARLPQQPTKRWDAAGTLGTGILVNPVVADGLVVFAGLDRKVHAVEAATGFPAWQQAALLPAMPFAPPAVVGDQVIVLASDGSLLALRLRDGSEVWRLALGGKSSGPPLAVDAMVFAVSEAGRVVAVDAATGGERWNTTVGAVYDQVGPTWLNGRIIVGTRAGVVHALHPLTGKPIWSTDVGAPVTATPVGLGHRVVVPTLGLKALDFDTGHVAWTVEASSFVRSSPSTMGGVLVYGDPDAPGLVAVNAQTTERMWRVPTRLYVRSAPVIADGFAVAASEDGMVHAVQLRNGSVLWERDAGERVKASPVVLAGSVLVARMDGIVRLLADPDAPGLSGQAAAADGGGRASDGLTGLLPVFAVLAAPYIGLKYAVKRMRTQLLEARARQLHARPLAPATPRVPAGSLGPVKVQCPDCHCRFGVEPRHHTVVACPACGRKFVLRRRSASPATPATPAVPAAPAAAQVPSPAIAPATAAAGRPAAAPRPRHEP